jgi:hypothetical protein
LKDESENPDKWFSKLENLRIQLKQDHNVIIDDDKMRTQILFNTKPAMYSTIIAILKRDLNTGTIISLTDIKLEYRQVFSTVKVTPKSRETGKKGHKRKTKQNALQLERKVKKT